LFWNHYWKVPPFGQTPRKFGLFVLQNDDNKHQQKRRAEERGKPEGLFVIPLPLHLCKMLIYAKTTTAIE
jgi:hypothetical protein